MDIKPTYTWDLLLNLKHVISCLSTIQRVVRLPSTVTVSRSQEINKQVVSSMKAIESFGGQQHGAWQNATDPFLETNNCNISVNVYFFL